MFHTCIYLKLHCFLLEGNGCVNFFKLSIVSKMVSFCLVIACQMKFTIGKHWPHNAGYIHEVLDMNLLHAHVLLINKNSDMKWELLSCI
jgi:hypothetical protein